MNANSSPDLCVFDRIVIDLTTTFPEGLRTSFSEALRTQAHQDRQGSALHADAKPPKSAPAIELHDGVDFHGSGFTVEPQATVR